MHAAQGPCMHIEGNRTLIDRCFQTKLFESLGAKHRRKEAPLIAKWLRSDNEQTFNIRVVEFHFRTMSRCNDAQAVDYSTLQCRSSFLSY